MKYTIIISCCWLYHLLLVVGQCQLFGFEIGGVEAFAPSQTSGQERRRQKKQQPQQQPQKQYIIKKHQSSIFAIKENSNNDMSSSNNNNKQEKKRGYKFGDITKGLIGNSVNSLTGKDDYEFGDLTRWIDQQAKNQVNQFTNRTEYQFGDISKELIRRLKEGEYTQEDVMFLLQIVVSIGLEFQPIAQILPIKILVDMLNLSVASSMQQRVGNVISKELDRRFKDKYFNMGTATKVAVSTFTGKDQYEFGDITKKLREIKTVSTADNKKNKNDNDSSKKNNQAPQLIFNNEAQNELKQWDDEFLAKEQQAAKNKQSKKK